MNVGKRNTMLLLRRYLMYSLFIAVIPLSLHAQKIDSSWYKPRKLMGQYMPAITGETTKGKIIDNKYFSESVTLLAFGNLVNIGSLRQIELLNKIENQIADTSFKLLSVMPNAISDVKDFNSSKDNASMAYQLRMTYQFPIMEYDVLATCENRNADNTLHVACDNVVKDYLIGGYPVAILVDKKNIVRFVHVGMAPNEKEKDWMEVIIEQINSLLKESN